MKNTLKTTWLEHCGLCATVLMIALAICIVLPVQYTLYAQPNDGDLHPADPLTMQTPLQQCIEGRFENVTNFDILFGTYGRRNTNAIHAEFFTLENGKKNILAEKDFSSSILKDNDYYSITFPAITAAPKFCFMLDSGDGTAQNSVTYWLNGQSQPVVKVRSTVPLYKAMEKIVEASRFGLPNWAAVALCLLYLGATVGALFIIWNETQEKQQVSKKEPPHPGRARKKRV